MGNMDTGHDADDATGADYFTVHAGVALDDVRDPVDGFNADELERLAAAARTYADELAAIVARGRGAVAP